MKSYRSLMFPLLAAMAMPSLGIAANPNKKASFAYVNAILGSEKTDIVLDNKTIYRNMRFGKMKKPKFINNEGYNVEINASKVGYNYLSFQLDVQEGKEYLVVPMGNLTTMDPLTSIVLTRPAQPVPKVGAHVAFVVAAPDATLVDLIINGNTIAADMNAGETTGPLATLAGKFEVELQVEGVTVYGPKKMKLKKGKTTTFVMTGTVSSSDPFPVDLEMIATKGF